VAEPVEITSGCPLERTRTVEVDHMAVTQGPPEFGGKGHPAIVHGAVASTAGDPAARTLTAGAVAWAWPPWAQMAVDAVVHSEPGITSPPGLRR
jgi:hypothetical protein